MDWMVRGLNPDGGEIFCNRPNWPWGPPTLLYSGYFVSCQGVKWPGHGVDHLPQSSTEVEEQVDYNSASTLGLHGLF